MTEQIIIQRSTAEALFEKLQTNERPVVINALEKEGYIAKRIPGSINVPADEADRIDDIVPDKDQEIVTYCGSADCPASNKLAKSLIDKGYTNVWDFEDGIEGWNDAGYKLSGHKAN